MSPLPEFIRREVERAIAEGESPAGMSLNDGKTRIGADKLRYLLAWIDRAAQAPAAQGAEAAHEARREAQRELERYKGLLARARLDLMRELREQGWTPPAAQAPAAEPLTDEQAMTVWARAAEASPVVNEVVRLGQAVEVVRAISDALAAAKEQQP